MSFDALPYDVSRETSRKLDRFATLLGRWNKKINLIAPSTAPVIFQRHILDSAQLWPLEHGDIAHWADLGAGGGLPALVLAVVAAQMAPEMRFTLVESDGRKAAFLRVAALELELGAQIEILCARIEQLASLQADVVSARALAPLERLLGLACPHLAPGGMCLFPKGRTVGAEIEAARENWHFDLVQRPSMTNPSAMILQIERPRRA